MNENQKADDIAQRINIILVSMDAQDLKEKAVCLLEQAYLLLFTDHSEYSMPSSDRLQVENCQMMIFDVRGIEIMLMRRL
jgi:hypothetical protein